MSKTNEEKEDEFRQAYYAAIGRRVEAERKQKEEADAKAAAEDAQRNLIRQAVREAIKDDEVEKRAKAARQVKQAGSAALLAGALAFYGMLAVQQVEDE